MKQQMGNLPDIFTFEDGSRLTKKEDWLKRAREIKKSYEYHMYGPLPDTLQEQVTYEILNVHEEMGKFKEKQIEKEIPIRRGEIIIKIARKGREVQFTGVLTLPTSKPREGGYPLFSEMNFFTSQNTVYAAMRGCASVSWKPMDIASDNLERTGIFYTLYPYGDTFETQTGALAAWGWGASKVLDAFYQGAGAELQVNTDNNILAGVSRYGKATAVAGAYDERIRLVMPTCSGAGGMTCYRYDSEGKTYDLSSVGYFQDDTSMYTMKKNEPLEVLQSDGERHWFNEVFRKFTDVEQFPMDQHFLAALMASEKRTLFIVAGHNAEDWTNPAGMAVTYLAARPLYQYLGLEEHLLLHIHESNVKPARNWNEGNTNPNHAVFIEDMAYMLDYIEVQWYGKEPSEVASNLQDLHTCAFFEDVNWDKDIEQWGLKR